jgi:hypothetical protein
LRRVAASLLLLALGFAKRAARIKPEQKMVVRMWMPVPNDPSTDIYGSLPRKPLLREPLVAASQRGRSRG